MNMQIKEFLKGRYEATDVKKLNRTTILIRITGQMEMFFLQHYKGEPMV